jgi:hypothetical protein
MSENTVTEIAQQLGRQACSRPLSAESSLMES